MSGTANDPIYPLSVAARMLGVHPRTIRLYEDGGLVTPSRLDQKRYFSGRDIEWIQCLRNLIHDKGISIPGIRKLLDLTPCWELKECPPTKRATCSAYRNLSKPCWERAQTTCARGTDHCTDCEVFLQHLTNRLQS